MFKKGFAPIIIVLIIALLAVGGITGYTLIKNKQHEGIITTTTSILTTSTTKSSSAVPPDWITYRNENGDYEIKYPPDLIIKHTTPLDLTITTKSTSKETNETSPFRDSLEINSPDNSTNPVEWRIEVYSNKDELTVQQRAEQIGTAAPSRNKVITKITVGGIEGRKVVIDSLPSDVDPENTIENATSIFIINGENIYEFFCLNKITKKSGIQNYDSYRFNQILSSFKFLE